MLLELQIKTEHVQIFSGEFNREIHDELKRMRRTLWASLELWQMQDNIDLSDVIFHHVLSENATESEVASVEQYVRDCLALDFNSYTNIVFQDLN